MTESVKELEPVGRIERAGVVGCGLMGSGIAEVCARQGLDVVVVDADDTALKAGRERVETSLAGAVRRGKLEAEVRDRAVEAITYSTDLGAMADRQIVIEAVSENEPLKTGIFRSLDDIVEWPDAILASNTSSIPIMRLGMATGRPEQVLGIHFFNPVPVMPLVELVTSLATSAATAERAATFAESVLGKAVIRAQDRAGFIVNGLLIPYLLSAIRMLESGFATAEDIDAGMVKGCAHPMGPLTLADLIGLDTTLAIAETLHAEFKEPQYVPPSLLHRMVEAGRYGRKSGQGFYTYSRDDR